MLKDGRNRLEANVNELNKVSVVLKRIEKPLHSPWKDNGGFVMALAAMPFLVFSIINTYFIVAAAICALVSILLFASSKRPLLGEARRFFRETRKERKNLIRTTEAHNRAWFLAERGQHLLGGGSQDTQVSDPFRASHEKLLLDVEAYARRYASAVAADMGLASTGRNWRAVRRSLRDRAETLLEFESRLDGLGAQATEAMCATAAAQRAALENDCREAGMPLASVSRKLAKKPAARLPTAKMISER